jgi:hypothetical protein
MSSATTNGSSPAHVAWSPESPFLSDLPPAPTAPAGASPAHSFAQVFERESPFVAEYAGETDGGGPRAEQFAALVSDLADEEFEEALEELVNEATAIAEDRRQAAGEMEDEAGEALGAEEAVRSYLEPIARAAEQMLDGAADRLATVDLTSAGDNEVDTLLETVIAPEQGLSPVADQFLGKLAKKARKALKSVKKIAGKVTSFLPHNLILKKLKGLVRPLLQKVLKSALNRVPVALRPIATQLAKKFLGVRVAEATEEGEFGEGEEEASVDPVSLAEDLDAELAGTALDGESFENEAAVERAVAEDLAPTRRPLRDLMRARRRFARKCATLKAGEPVEPVVEEFVPAILAALKLGIKIIGRPKVVKTLSDLVAGFAKKYIGEQPARQLAPVLVDAGLRLMSLEAVQESDAEAAGHAVGATIEDTVTRLVRDVPESAWESEAVLASYAMEAFQQSASAHFPDSLIRSELHEATSSSGVWVAMPRAGANKSYKKYSRVLEVTLTPQNAAATTTFGGIPLRSFLGDRLGVTVDRPLKVRVHLYEALAGTSLGLIALGEKGVPLLGTARRAGRGLLHPLTPEAATGLLGEPGLGRPIGPKFLARRGRIAVGQRFYFLDVPGARLREGGSRTGARPARSSRPRVVLDFPKRELRLGLYFSESDAQRLAAQFRAKASAESLVGLLKGLHEPMLKKMLAGDGLGGVRLIHEAAPVEELAAPLVGGLVRAVGGKLAARLRDWTAAVLGKELSRQYDRFAGDFVNATTHEADGVTLTLTFQAPPFLEKLRKALKGGIAAIPAAAGAFSRDALGSYAVGVRPGYQVR